jgi:hypothetical protein
MTSALATTSNEIPTVADWLTGWVAGRRRLEDSMMRSHTGHRGPSVRSSP